MLLGWLNQVLAWWRRKSGSTEQLPLPPLPSTDAALSRLERIVLSDGVARTLFEEYANHRRSPRGDEEIGWVLLGLRQGDQAIALAALPAGTQRESGVAHVLFNRDAQELASRILRQNEKRLKIIGVVHTHPGHLRYPSEGDFQGDRLWVGQLRGAVGVFGIGTADAKAGEPTGENHRQGFGALCFSWYALGQGDLRHRPLPVQVTLGSDLAQPLLCVWHLLEAYAPALNRLCRQLTRVHIEVIDENMKPLLAVKIPLAEPQQQLRLLLNEREARYYWDRQGEILAVDPNEPLLDRAVYLILAELAKEPTLASYEAQTLVES